MKLILQIAIGVLIGNLASQLIIDRWHAYQEDISKSVVEKFQAEREKFRMEQGERIRNLLLQNRQGSKTHPKKTPDGFLPDDAKDP